MDTCAYTIVSNRRAIWPFKCGIHTGRIQYRYAAGVPRETTVCERFFWKIRHEAQYILLLSFQRFCTRKDPYTSARRNVEIKAKSGYRINFVCRTIPAVSAQISLGHADVLGCLPKRSGVLLVVLTYTRIWRFIMYLHDAATVEAVYYDKNMVFQKRRV